MEDGNLDVIQGSTVRLQIQLDRPAVETCLLLDDPLADPTGEDSETELETIPMQIDGDLLRAPLPSDRDRSYSIIARADDGTELADNRYQLRIRVDRPPHVTFHSSEEPLEVHALAEVPMAIRVNDDFGIGTAGVVFQVNAGEERTLIVKDFAGGSPGPASQGSLPVTRDEIRELLCLEEHTLTPKDAITYYAFVEDNFPDRPHRVETDLRFIDIRPFKRIYRMVEQPPAVPRAPGIPIIGKAGIGAAGPAVADGPRGGMGQVTQSVPERPAGLRRRGVRPG